MTYVLLALLHSTGIAGYAGNTSHTCAECHTGGVAPMKVQISGPTMLEVGQSGTYQIDVVSGATAQTFAGIDVASSGGTLAVHPGGNPTRLIAGELTHSQTAGPGATVSFEFDFTAPAQTGMVTLFGDGLSANGTGDEMGDDNATTQFQVTVVPSGTLPDASMMPPDAAPPDAVTGATSMSTPMGEDRWGCACQLGRHEHEGSPWLLLAVALVVACVRARYPLK